MTEQVNDPLNKPKPPISREALRNLDPEFWTDEKIDAQMESWTYQPPSDFKELLDLAHRGSRFEEEMRGLNTDRREGDITETEYQERAQELQQKYFKKTKIILLPFNLLSFFAELVLF